MLSMSLCVRNSHSLCVHSNVDCAVACVCTTVWTVLNLVYAQQCGRRQKAARIMHAYMHTAEHRPGVDVVTLWHCIGSES